MNTKQYMWNLLAITLVKLNVLLYRVLRIGMGKKYEFLSQLLKSTKF